MYLEQFNDTPSLNDYFCKKLQVILTQAIDQRDQAYLVVSGGKTPKSLFKQLSQANLDWGKVTVLLTDERWLAPSNPESNEYLVKNHLLINKAVKAHYISLLSEANNPYQGINDIEARLKDLPQFDVVILGMGEDGHTASLFPCSQEVDAGLTDLQASVIAIRPKTAPHERVSLTKNRLEKSRFIFLYLIGENKLAVLNQAIAGDDSKVMPIRAFLHNPVINVEIVFSP